MIIPNNNTKVFFTSDTHIHHNREFVWEARGYSSVDEHDMDVINTINDCVGKDDTLIHLGDFCLNTSIEQFDQYLERINCNNIYMLFGNHPNPHYKNVYKPMVKTILGDHYTNESEVYPLRYRNIVYYGHHQTAIINGQFIVLNHYPIYVWENMQHGSWLLCGHSHHGCSFSVPETEVNKVLDVGWDGFHKPLSFSDVSDIMQKKKIVANDLHHTPKINS